MSVYLLARRRNGGGYEIDATEVWEYMSQEKGGVKDRRRGREGGRASGRAVGARERKREVRIRATKKMQFLTCCQRKRCSCSVFVGVRGV